MSNRNSSLRIWVRPNMSGQAIVEMALVATLLLMLSFGIADVGLYIEKYISVANCTREAARNAAVRSSIPSCTGLVVTYSDSGHAAGTTVTATVNTTHSWLVIGYLIPGIGETIALQSHTSMRMEGTRI